MTSASEQRRDHPGPEKGEAYGAAAVTQALEGLDFPATKQDIFRHIQGREQIDWTKEKTVNLRELLEQTGREWFENMRELLDAIGEIV
ncbi:hypothetical protein A6770_02600 [Nostoc minutum NIES-26]|uniref:DUF2795 domain-containing protein n=1 Tax=Nostoc minutum NIES-26 TaxID=1844469 RepID=A0A367QTK8_9NOSO|nr:hypothetical protein A6770_02600 [Nostoc minutum NIES-26]